MSARDVLDGACTEADFQDAVIGLAQTLGYYCYHVHDSRRSQAGYPDLTMIGRNGRLVFAELKAEGKQPTPAQRQWLEALSAAPGIVAECWHPSDWPHIVKVLQG